MRFPNVLATASVTALLALAGCGDQDDPADAPTATTATEATTAATTTAAEPTTTKPEPKPTGLEVVAADSQYGSILFDSQQRAIYLFDLESSDTSECYDACADAWPPVLTDGDPVAGKGIDQSLVGTTERDDGEVQVTYAGHPLYYYVDDPPGQVLCHNVSEFGGLWLVVQPDGEPAA